MIRFLKSAWSSELATGASSAFVIQVGGLFVGYVSSILLTRVTGRTEYGVYAYALSIVLVLVTLGSSFNQLLITRFVPEYFSTERWNLLKGIIVFSIRNMVAISVGIAVLGSALLLIWPSIVQAEYHAAMLIALWTLPLWMVMRVFSSSARSYGKITRAYLPQRLFRALGMGVAAGIALMLGRSLSGAQATTISLVLMIGLLLVQIFFYYQIRPPQLRGIEAQINAREWAWIGVPLLISSVAAAIQSEGATIVVGSLMSADDVGLFSVASRISNLVNFPFMALSSVVIPRFAPLMTRDDIPGIQKLIRQMVLASTLIAAVIAAGLLVATPLILSLFGPEFTAARIETYLLSGGYVMLAATGPGYGLLTVTGHENRAMFVALISAVIHIAMTIVGVVYFGSIGAAAAVFLTALISGILQNIAVVRALGVYTAFIFHIPPFKSRVRY